MAELLLHGAYIRAALEQMSCEKEWRSVWQLAGL